MKEYVNFINQNWILLSILWVAVVILARSKINMFWMDMIVPSIGIIVWSVGILFIVGTSFLLVKIIAIVLGILAALLLAFSVKSVAS
jgi:hypothetical protein